jgi:hypothetical protein
MVTFGPTVELAPLPIETPDVEVEILPKVRVSCFVANSACKSV